MRGRSILPVAFLALLAACSGGGSVPGTASSGGTGSLVLSPSPLDLTDVMPADSFTVAGDVAGVSYTPLAQPDCTGPDGSIAIAGDGQAQVDQTGAPLMFLVYATGATPPGTCDIVVRGSDGTFGAAQVTYQVLVLETAAPHPVPAAIAAVAGVSPASVTIAKSDQVVPIDASGFSGTATVTVGAGCTSGSGIQVTPKSVDGSGTFTVVPFGQGAIAKSCTLDIADASGGHASVAVTLAIAALAKFTASPAKVQFGCASGSPAPCLTTQTVELSEAGAQTFSIATKPGYRHSCANAFLGPMTMTAGGGTYGDSTSGPSASVSFYGLLPGTALTCSQIIVTDNGDPAQRVTLAVAPQLASPPPPLGPAAAPPCTGPDPHVAVPNAPHGMYVWSPYDVDGGAYESQIVSDVVGKDPTLCGVSLVVKWSDLEPTKGDYEWSTIDDPQTGLAAPYVNAGLTVNLLFSAGPERGERNPVTPDWVTSPSGDDVPVVQCTAQPPAPDYMSPTFERDWFAFIAKAIEHYSYQNSAMAPHIGYMRFAIGFGVEALPGHFDDGAHADCLPKWEAAPVNFTYDGWVQHSKNVVNAMAAQSTDKQLLVALNNIPGGASFYDYPNAVGQDAASKGIGFGTENLGIANVALPTASPAACNPQAKIENLYWCQAFVRHVGVVPFEFQTDVASTAPQPGESPIDLGKALQYGMDNNAQIFELYPQEWLAADVDGFTTPADQAAHKQALQSASLVLGAHASPSP